MSQGLSIAMVDSFHMACGLVAGPSSLQLQRQQSTAHTSSLSASMSACLTLKWCLLAAQQLRGWLRYPRTATAGSSQPGMAEHSSLRHLLQVNTSFSPQPDRTRCFHILTCCICTTPTFALAPLESHCSMWQTCMLLAEALAPGCSQPLRCPKFGIEHG